ncbi:hypothetical protein KFL_003080040 [Klebsormidium nitens]|uniref:FBD domain-containing protein n=1 Tax=Klebsormidium nitens TaxID=105231 RepID=A0A1Y1I884_KLENI|nr:hypothetical protein KFL_003080040 [Klebsormidium nitens]|eukprot:GAQ86733.1 hypothetical protein KFL_003080040 [Klebsormidium nitens]
MAARAQGAPTKRQTSAFDVLYPELVDYIVEKAAKCTPLKRLGGVQWTSVQARAEGTLDVLLQRLPASRLSLKSLDLDLSSGGKAELAFDVNKDMRRILQVFPNLENLKLRGDWFAPCEATNQLTDKDDLNTCLTTLVLSSFKLPPCSQVFKSLSFLTALRSLQLTCEFDGSLALSPSASCSLPSLQALQTLQIDVFDEALVDSHFLPNLAEHCPNLQRLLLRTVPVYAQGKSVGELAPQIAELQEKCPLLEQIVISRSEMLFRARFLEVLVQSDLAPEGYVDISDFNVPIMSKKGSKMLILEDSTPEGSELWRGSCSVTLFRFVVLFPFEERRIPGDRKRIQRRLLGNAAAISSWFHAFV